MTLRNPSCTVGRDGVAVITLQAPDGTLPLIDEGTIEELGKLTERIAGDSAIKGAVITGADGKFCAGADPRLFERLISDSRTEEARSGAEEATRRLQERAGRLSRLYRRLETQGKPVVAAINGAALGAGLELALACHRRIVEDHPENRLGMPQVTIGLMPGAGGTQRLPRLVGAEAALGLMLHCRLVQPQEALKAGLVDELVPEGGALARAQAWIAEGGRGVQAFDEKGFRLPGGEVYSARGQMLWPVANAVYRKDSFDNYQARRAVLHAVYEGLLVKTMAAALKIEERWLTHVLKDSQIVPMLRTLYYSMGALAQGVRRPKGPPLAPVRRLGIVGAGFMGSGIAHVTAREGIDVVLIDRDQPAADKGKAHSAGLMEKEIGRGRASREEAAAVAGRIHAGTDLAALADCDLVIEAVFENKALKAEILADIDRRLASDAILASNTSTLPITELAGFTRRPAEFVGIHFFSPVDRMQLVEIIRGKATGERALAKAIDFVRQIGKTPIVVNDSRGFFTSRVVMTYMAEGCEMLAEGVPPALIENAARMAGMPVGPLALNDEIALDLAWKILQVTKADLGEAYRARAIDRIIEEMVVKRERFGRKNRRGFYDYPQTGRKRLWDGIAEIAKPRPADQFDSETLKERLLLIQALETARCFEEGVLTDPREGDVGAILGFGFAPWTGGPLSYIDMVGVDRFVRRCSAFEQQLGARYRPARLLSEMAETGRRFYDDGPLSQGGTAACLPI
jgi:3-hydroxyacyl-CoA dehydrogenase/enoyl-CoA hydratase/3-hydroxybutyryl-CoA epimerase